MRKTDILGAALVLALAAACSKPTPARSGNGSTAANASAPGSVAASNGSTPAPARAPASAAGPVVTLNPGEWETVTETAMTGIPADMPPNVAAQMKNQKVTSRHCLTPEKAAHPGADFFGKGRKECANKIVMAGGRVGGTMTCKDPRGATSTISIDGRYGGDSMDMAMKMTMNAPGRSMSFASHMVGRRVGACPAGAKDD